jgi:hypothetical protein
MEARSMGSNSEVPRDCSAHTIIRHDLQRRVIEQHWNVHAKLKTQLGKGSQFGKLIRYFNLFTSTFELRPLWSYFSRRGGGKSSGEPSLKPAFD